MKKMLKRVASLTLVLLVLLSLTVTAFASSASITFYGFSQGFDFEPGSEYTETDLFNNFKDVMPGDVLTEEIVFTNSATDCDFINLYMRAEVHDEEENPLTYSETYENEDGKDQANIDGERDETVATMQDFLSQLSMKVWNGTELIYDASPDELDGLKENKFLGTFRTGETTTLKVELTVPIELGNEYANRVGEVDWIFHVEAYNESQLTVRKVWSDGNSYHSGEGVQVNLLKDGEVVQTQELNAENGWTYTFDRLVEGHTWTVEEANVPRFYTASYNTVGTMTTITNTKKSHEYNPPEPDEPDPVTPVTPVEPLPTTESITVNKVWSGDEKSQRPDNVTVTLYDGETAFDSVNLNASNNWTYTWTDLDSDGNWQVVEVNIPKDYTPSYVVNGDTVTITNTRTLIQTGQTNWTIWVFGGAGLVLIGFGCVMLLKKKKEVNA